MDQNPYETQAYVANYLLMHYGRPEDQCPFDLEPSQALHFHEQLLRQCVLPLRFTAPTRALDVGCSVGRFAFELSRVVDYVLGIDYSKAFVEGAREMASGHGRAISIKESGKADTKVNIMLPGGLPKGEVEFQVGDAMDLASYPDGSFHLVAAINLLCRLPNPRQFLSQLHRLVVPEGQLLIASPYSWEEAYTPEDQWLNSQEVEKLLEPHFRRVDQRDLPFLFREHRRKYQLVFSEVSVFIRR